MWKLQAERDQAGNAADGSIERNRHGAGAGDIEGIGRDVRLSRFIELISMGVLEGIESGSGDSPGERREDESTGSREAHAGKQVARDDRTEIDR
jgi:hypothetical protein